MLAPGGPAMVSTLREAEVFAEAGVTDLTYGVGIAPDKLDRVLALRRRGVDIGVILDSVAQAEAVAAASTRELPLAALIEIDCDGHRSGVAPEDAELLRAIAQALTPAGGAARGADACRRELRRPRHGGARGGGGTGAPGGRRRRRDAARGGPRLPGGQRRLDADADERASPRRADRVPRRGLRVLRPVPGRRRRLRDRRHRALGARHGHRAPAGQGLDDHRRRLDGDVARPRHGEPGGRPGLRRRLRPRRPAARRPHRDRREPGARHRRAAPGQRDDGARPADRHPAAGAAEPRLRHRGAVRPVSCGQGRPARAPSGRASAAGSGQCRWPSRS